MAYWVDINNSYSSTGAGTSVSPFSWSQFITDLADASLSTRTYYVSGTRTLSTNTTITIDSIDTSTTGASVVTINDWDGEPWRIIGDASVGIININSSYVRYLYLRGGMIQGTKSGFFSTIYCASTPSSFCDVTIDSMWINFYTSFVIRNYDDVYVYNSLLSDTNQGLVGSNPGSFGVYNSDTATIRNTILAIGAFSAPDSTNTLDNVVSTRVAFPITIGSSIDTSSSVQLDWESDPIVSSAVNLLSASNISYLTSSFDGISATGNASPALSYTWFDGTRDGVGALYFPTITVSASATPSSAAAGDTITIDINDVFTEFSASSATFNFGDSTSTTVNEPSATHVYSAVDDYSVTVSVLSKNEWYSSVSDAITVSISAGDASATFEFLDSDTSAVTTSAETYTDVLMSATIVSGDVVSYIMDWGDGTSSTYTGSDPISTIPVLTHQYISSGSLTGTISVNNRNPFNKSLNTYIRTPTTYYVDINNSYTSSGNGLLATPLNYSQFKTTIEDGGDGEFGDIFKLKGYRELTYGTDFVNSLILIADPTLSFVIDAWDLSAYGPWMISPEIYPGALTSILSFKNSTLKNGILYNRVYFDNRGVIFYLSSMKDTFVVNQGTNSRIILSPSTQLSGTPISGCDIIGSTLYCENGYRDNADQAYDINLTDSVFVGFENQVSGTYFTSATVNITNSTFTDDASSLLSGFNIGTSASSQYGWTAPTDYPFTPTNEAYGQSLDWLLLNKRALRPFSGITTPPNPGDGYDTYPGYTTGLFGNSRKDYEAP